MFQNVAIGVRVFTLTPLSIYTGMFTSSIVYTINLAILFLAILSVTGN